MYVMRTERGKGSQKEQKQITLSTAPVHDEKATELLQSGWFIDRNGEWLHQALLLLDELIRTRGDQGVIQKITESEPSEPLPLRNFRKLLREEMRGSVRQIA